jgi:ABC-type oligopeptide transport system substrate-binding subunit
MMIEQCKKMAKVTTTVIALVLVLASCGGGANGEKTLTVAREVPSDNLNYLTNEFVNNAQVIGNFSEGLVTYNNEGKLIPGLAASWDNKDNVYTFTLRDGLKWSNGTKLTAADFVFGLQTLASKQDAPYRYFLEDVQNGAEVVRGEKPVTALGVKALSETSLELTFVQNRVYILEVLAHSTFLPLNEAFYNEVGADNYGTSAETIIASGAFMLTDYNPAVEYTMEKNPHYWDAANVKLDRVTTRVIKESATQDTLYANGELDILEVPANLYDKYAGDSKLVEMPYGRLYYFFISGNTNTPAPILANADFRAAIGLAIDKEILATNVFKDGSAPLDHLVPNDIAPVAGKPYREFTGEGHDGTYKFNVAQAQERLAKARAVLGDDELVFKLSYQEREENRRVFENIQAQLETNLPGVKVTLESMPSQTYFQEATKQTLPAGYSGWTPSYNDMSTYFQVFLSTNSLNFSNYNNEAYDRLYAEGQQELDPVKRARIFQQAEKVLLDDGVIVPLAQRGKRYVVQDTIKGFNFNSTFPEINFRYISVG